MNSLFSYRQPKKFVDVAIENVRLYRQERLAKLETAKIYLIGQTSPIRSKIIEASKKGKLEVNIDFQELNKEYKFNCVDHIFVNEEIDQLLISVTDFLEKEGFNHTVIEQSIIINWPDPETCKISDQTDDRQDLTIGEQTTQKPQ